jgi:predicted nucleotide-binding protein (sugar kinase/HSP70/actin superfamily)
LAEEILSLNHQYGESWLIAGEIGAFVREGVNNVLCLQPFGCIANHVIAKGVQKRLQENIHSSTCSSSMQMQGSARVNFFNRLHFFINQAKNGSSSGENPTVHPGFS